MSILTDSVYKNSTISVNYTQQKDFSKYEKLIDSLERYSKKLDTAIITANNIEQLSKREFK